MDDWAFTGWPWNLHRGQEGRRLKGKQEWFVDVCALLSSVWPCTFKTLQDWDGWLKPLLVCWWRWYMFSIVQPQAWSYAAFSLKKKRLFAACFIWLTNLTNGQRSHAWPRLSLTPLETHTKYVNMHIRRCLKKARDKSERSHRWSENVITLESHIGPNIGRI